MVIEIQASSLALSREEMGKYLSPETMQKLQGKTVHPWIVGETGTSRPRDLKSGKSRALTWGKRAIQSLKNAIHEGTKLFVNHGNGTNSHEGRSSVGVVVDTFNRELPDGRTQAIALGLLDQEQNDMNICSIEADVDISESGEVMDVPSVSAIALGNSSTDSPAFPGAQRMAAMQFFDKPEDKKEIKGGRMTFAEIKTAVEEMGLSPHRLFSADDIKNDNRLMKGINGDLNEKILTLEKERDGLKTNNENLTKTVEASADATKRVAVQDGKKKLEAMFPDGTTEAQKKFLVGEFSPEGEKDLSEESLNSYIEQGNKRFSEMAKLFGEVETPPTGGKDKGDPDGATTPEDKLLKEIING